VPLEEVLVHWEERKETVGTSENFYKYRFKRNIEYESMCTLLILSLTIGRIHKFGKYKND
jgi:hypothetical protein